MTLSELEAVVNKHMLLKDKNIVKLLCAFVVANRLEVPAPFLFIVGSSSGGKSMLLNSLKYVKGGFALDDLTSNTFVSGQKSSDKETSLLFRFTRQTFLVFKDWTVIIDKEKEARGMIVAQMRKIFDGDFVKTYGNGMEHRWQGKVGVIAGTTTSIHAVAGKFAALGERFVMYNFDQPDPMELGYQVARNKIADFAANEEMSKAFKEYLDESIVMPETMPDIDPQTVDDIVELANFTTSARSAVGREEFSRDKEINMLHAREMPARFLKQLMAISYGLGILNGDNKLTLQDRKIIYKIALDSIPMLRKMILVELTRHAQASVGALSITLGLPRPTVMSVLEDLNALKMVVKSKGMGNQLMWELKDSYRMTISRFEDISIGNDTLENEDEFADATVKVEGGPGANMPPPDMPVSETEALAAEIGI